MRGIRTFVRFAVLVVVVAIGVLPATAAPAPVSESAAVACSDLVANGGFELTGGWVIGETPRPAVRASDNAHDGAYSMRLGITSVSQDAYSYSSIRQRITVPSGGSSATLRFWLWPATLDTVPYDSQQVLILDTAGRVLATVRDGLSDSRAWEQVSYDMSAFIGRTVDLYFGVLNDGKGRLPTWMYVDDVSITACGTQVTVSPAAGAVGLGSTTTVDIRVEGVSGLYGAQVALTFDPALLQVQDADGATAGVQIMPGDFPNPGGGAGSVIDRTANNSTGRITYAVVLRAPALPVTGSGVLARVTFKGMALGTSALTVSDAVLVDQAGRVIPCGVTGGTLQVAVGTGAIRGLVGVQGRTDRSGTTVTAHGLTPVQTMADGSFVISNVPAGTYSVVASRPGYLASQIGNVAVTTGTSVGVPPTLLRGGDANHDSQVSLPDLVSVGSNFMKTPPTDPNADLNGDGTVNIVDLVLVGGNWGLSAPQPWLWWLISSAEEAEPARVQFGPTLTHMEAGETRTVDIRVQDVQNLFGAELDIRFDPAKLRVIDADPVHDGVQIANGPFLVPDGDKDWFGRYNEVDNASGIISYSGARITGTGPEDPVSGSGVIATITFQALEEGSVVLSFHTVDLMETGAVPISNTRKNGGVFIGPVEQLNLPIVRRH